MQNGSELKAIPYCCVVKCWVIALLG